jgi:hypothetical protein
LPPYSLKLEIIKIIRFFKHLFYKIAGKLQNIFLFTYKIKLQMQTIGPNDGSVKEAGGD